MFLSSRRGLRIGTAVARISRRYQLSRSFSTEAPRYPIPPFTLETAIEKTKMAEDAWNTKDPEKVSMAYSKDSEWRNRSVFVKGRSEIKEFLTDKWKKELDYKLEKRYWCHANNRIAVRFAYEYRNADGEWFRAHGNENWEFDELGYMTRREASINDVPIDKSERVIAIDGPPQTKDNPKWT